MKKTRYTEEQIAFALKQAETGTWVEEVYRKMGISEATFYNWKKKFGGMGVTELRRLRQLEEENHRSPISVWTRICCRTSSEKSSEAGAETRGGRLPASGVRLFLGSLPHWPQQERAGGTADGLTK